MIDFHVHVLEPEVLARGIDRNVASGFGARQPEPPGTRMAAVREKMLNPDTQIEDMDRLGIDVSVLSSATVIQGTAWADAGTADALNRRANEAIAGWVERFPDRFVGSFTLPLQNQRLALRELDRCVDALGLRVANLPARVGEHYLGHRSFAGLWEAVAERGLTVFVHPDGVEDPWFQEYSLWNSVGQPIEETKVMASLIYEGVLERHRDLRVVMSHGGGYLPHYYGRLDRNVHNLPASARNLSRRPSEYLRDFHYDTCVYDPGVLDALVDRVGADRLVLGSDLPVGEADPVGFVERCDKLQPAERSLVLGGTAASLLGLTGDGAGA